MNREEILIQARLAKLEKLRSEGIDPYPPRYHRTHSIGEAIELFLRGEEGEERPEVSLAGRIVGMRQMGKATFLDLRDGSGKVQVYFRQDSLGQERYQRLRDFDRGDFMGVRGQLFRTKTGEITVQASDFAFLSKSLRPLPEKWHGLTDVEKRYRQRYLDLLSNPEAREVFFRRSRLIDALRRFLGQRGFVEVETPVLQPVAAGALARPFATYHHTLEETLYLRIALELYLKRLIIGGLDRVYEIGRVFRNEGISTRHNPEFTMLESYEAYADYEDVMHLTEEMVFFAAQEVLGGSQIEFGGHQIDLSPPWRRVTLREAILDACGIDFERFPDEDSLRREIEARDIDIRGIKGRGKLIDKLLSNSVEPHLIQPTFVLDYPVELSPLAKRKPGAEHLVERFEAFIGGMEIANAFTELNDPQDQRQRFAEQEALRQALGDEEVERIDEDFLIALEHGMPPTGGLGVGVDRLAMLFTNQQSIREVILFPLLSPQKS